MTWPGKLALGLTTFFVAMAFFGITRNQVVKIEQMPAEIKYQVTDFDVKWPDQFYSSDYTQLGDQISLVNYWTLEISRSPLGSSKWVFHDQPLVITNANTVVKKFTR